jgi:hypothetical protein
MGPPKSTSGERRSRSPGVLAFAVLAVLLAACVVGTVVVLPGVSAPGVMVSQSPPVVYTPASRLQDYSIKIPASWKPGTKLGVKVRLPGCRHDAAARRVSGALTAHVRRCQVGTFLWMSPRE